MRSPILVLGLITLLLCPALAAGQSRRNSAWSLPWHDSQANRRQNDAPHSQLQTRIRRRRPDVYGSVQSLRLSTRPDRLRAELATMYSARRNRRERGLLPIERPPMSRVAQMLDSRNLLRSHSTLGRNRSALIGRQDYVIEADGRWRGEVTPAVKSPANLPNTDATTKPRSYASRLSERLEEKADAYYRLGIAYFREGQYPRSRDYFQLVRQLENDHPRAFVAIVLVSLQGEDINTAVTSLVHAIRRAESLADLRIEWEEFYTKEQNFQRVVNSVNLMAKSGAGTNKALNLMLAYYSFLNGDLNTAIAEAKAAEEKAMSGAPEKVISDLSSGTQYKDPFATAAKRFSEFLMAARDQGEAPDGVE